MIPLFSIVLLGFFLGMRHATDPDHVVAVTTIVSRERTLRSAAPLGALWGVGHTATILVVGGAIILFGLVIPPRLGLAMELTVAVMLVLLGGWNLRGIARRARAIAQGHAPALAHAHAGHGALDRLDGLLARLGPYRFVRPLLIGVVHGLAGSAAVALLVLGTMRSPLWAAIYLLVFGVGTVAGMLLITTALAIPFAATARRFERMHRSLAIGSAVLSVAFGMFLTYEIGFVHGLFTNHPQWTPG